MYIRFFDNYMGHRKRRIIDTSNAAGKIFIKRKIGEEMIQDLDSDKLITKKEYNIKEDKRIEELNEKWQKEKRKKEEQDLIDIEDELEKQEPKRKRGRPRKSPENKMINTNTLTTK